MNKSDEKFGSLQNPYSKYTVYLFSVLVFSFIGSFLGSVFFEWTSSLNNIAHNNLKISINNSVDKLKIYNDVSTSSNYNIKPTLPELMITNNVISNEQISTGNEIFPTLSPSVSTLKNTFYFATKSITSQATKSFETASSEIKIIETSKSLAKSDDLVNSGSFELSISCGVTSKNKQLKSLNKGRIVGGKNAEIINHPWQVYMKSINVSCSGSIINKNWILFAAHCAKGLNSFAGFWTVYAGVASRKEFFISAQRSTGVQLIKHNSFNPKTFENDIALLYIEPSLDFNDQVRPICLPPKDAYIETNLICEISGWGLTSEKGSPATILQSAKVRILNRNICRLPTWLNKNLKNDMLCAGTYFGTIDACNGDSGGPLACLIDGRKHILGVASWGVGCARFTKPGAYTKVSSYTKWIESFVL